MTSVELRVKKIHYYYHDICIISVGVEAAARAAAAGKCVGARVCARVYVHACVRVCVCVCTYDAVSSVRCRLPLWTRTK